MDNVHFSVWTGLDGHTCLDFDIPGYAATDVEGIGRYLQTLVQSELKSQHNSLHETPASSGVRRP